MANAVIILSEVHADNLDVLNRTAKCDQDVPNGTPLKLTASKTVGDNVFTAQKETTEDNLAFAILRKEPMIFANGSVGSEEVDAWLLEVTSNTDGNWMAYSPEVNKLVVGAVYGGADPRNFTNLANKPFDVFKLQVGDVIQVTKEFFESGHSPIEQGSATKVQLKGTGFQAVA